MEVWVLVEAGRVAGVRAVIAGALKVCIVTLSAGERMLVVNAVLGV